MDRRAMEKCFWCGRSVASPGIANARIAEAHHSRRRSILRNATGDGLPLSQNTKILAGYGHRSRSPQENSLDDNS